MEIIKFYRMIQTGRSTLFYEYFHGETGAGIGASHQTGWTGIIARTMHLFAQTSMDDAVKLGKEAFLKGT